MRVGIHRVRRGKKTSIRTRKPPDVQKLKQYVLKRAATAWRKSTREFLRVLVGVMAAGDHIDTAMSASSALPLAAKVRYATQLEGQIMASQKSRARKGYGGKHYVGDGQWHDDQFRSAAHGKRLGQQAISQKKHLISFGNEGDLRMKFKFEIVVYQYDYHETKSNWKTIERAKAAFLKTWRKELKDTIKLKALLNWIAEGNIFDAD